MATSLYRCPRCSTLIESKSGCHYCRELQYAAPAAPSSRPSSITVLRGIIAASVIGVCVVGAGLFAWQRGLLPGTGGRSPAFTFAGGVSPGLLMGPAVGHGEMDQRLLTAGATTGGELEFSLAWNTLSDIDIQVQDPAGELITAHQPRSASGGVQDVDANPTLVSSEAAMGGGPNHNPGAQNVLPVPEVLVDLDKKLGTPDGMPGFLVPGADGKAGSRFTRTPVEHTHFVRAPRGTYTVYVHCYSWREPNSTPLPYTVQVRSHGKLVHEQSGTIGPESFVSHNTTPTQVCQFVMR